MVKTPKVYWLDLGLWRHLTRYQGRPTGQMFETLVVTEVSKAAGIRAGAAAGPGDAGAGGPGAGEA